MSEYEKAANLLINEVDQCLMQKHYNEAVFIARKVIEEAVAAEQEACAKVADEHALFCHKEAQNGGSVDLYERARGAAHLAAALRAREP